MRYECRGAFQLLPQLQMQPPPLLPQLQTRSSRNRQVLPVLRVRAGNAGAKQRGALCPEIQLLTSSSPQKALKGEDCQGAGSWSGLFGGLLPQPPYLSGGQRRGFTFGLPTHRSVLGTSQFMRFVTPACRVCPARRTFRAHGFIAATAPPRFSGKFRKTLRYSPDGLLTSNRLGSGLA